MNDPSTLPSILPSRPLILLSGLDAELRALIETAAQAHGYHVDDQLNPARAATVQIAEMQPALIIVDSSAIPSWLAEVRANPATRRIPALAISEPGDGEFSAKARDAGVTDQLSRDELRAGLPDALTERVRLFTEQAMLSDECAQTPPALVLRGLHEFNARDYYECHETLEAAWKAERGPVRELYRVILQVGLAYYQIERGNFYGAQKMFLRTLQWFGPLPDQCQGINVAQLRADATTARAHLEALGAERIAEYDRTLLKPIHYQQEIS